MKYFILFLIIIIPALLLLRDIPDRTYSYIGDEYQFYLNAKRAIAHPFRQNIFSQLGVYGYHPVTDTMLQALVMKIAGQNVFGWKLTNILVLSFSTFLIYAIAQTIWKSTEVSLSASAFFGFSHYLFGFAHIGYNNLHALVPSLLGVYFLARWHRDKRNGFMVLAGISAGMCFYTFYSAQITALLLFVFVMTQKKQKRYFILAFLVLIIPFLLVNKVHLIKNIGDQVGIQSSGDIMYNFGTFLQSLVITLRTGNRHFTVSPIISPELTFLFAIGIIGMIRNKRNRGAMPLFLISWFLVTGIAVVSTFYQSGVPITRLHLIVPPVSLLAAYAMHEISLPKAVVIIVLLLYIGVEMTLFYYVMPRMADLTSTTLLLQLAQKHPEDVVCVGPDQYGDAWFSLDAYGVRNVRTLPAKPKTKPPHCTIIVRIEHDDDFFMTVGKQFIEGKTPNEYVNPLNRSNILTYYQ